MEKRSRQGVARRRRNADNAPAQRAQRKRDREQTIAAIVTAAETLLERKGPDGFGLAELGREAGVSFGLIHHYFGGKEGLLRVVLRRTLREMGSEIRRLQDDGSFWDADAPATLVVFDTFTNRPGFARLVAWGLLTGLIGPADIRKEFRTDREAVENMLEAFRKEAPAPSRDNAEVIATLLMSAVLGFNLLRPLLASATAWDEDNDARLRQQLARAMVGLTKSG
jgi:AcrR family transcriptional regulator